MSRPRPHRRESWLEATLHEQRDTTEREDDDQFAHPVAQTDVQRNDIARAQHAGDIHGLIEFCGSIRSTERVDEFRDAGIGRAGHAHARLDSTEHQVRGVLGRRAGVAEPCIVGHVYEEVRSKPAISAPYVFERRFIADYY